MTPQQIATLQQMKRDLANLARVAMFWTGNHGYLTHEIRVQIGKLREVLGESEVELGRAEREGPPCNQI